MKITITILLFCIITLTHPVFSQSYTVSPTVPDFMDLKASCVVATYGYTNDPFANVGIVNERHTIITKQGTDPSTGGKLQFLPDNDQKVIRLGNPQTGAEAESITYHFIADADRSVLLLKFAVVFQDPGHDLISQPRFMVRIMDADGDLIESCAEYDVSARPGIDGFQDYNWVGTPIRWRDWTNVGLDMSAYAGQEVQVQIITYDCNYSGHFGYAYFTASCVSNKLALEGCNGNNFTATAPEGFPSYLWNNGETTPSTQWKMADEDINLTCQVTSATGCQFILSAYAFKQKPETINFTFYDTVCEGDSYSENYYNLPPQTKPGNFTYYNSFFDINQCNGDVTNTLFLTVQQRFYPIHDEICQGEDYKQNGFRFIKPSSGTYYDTLHYLSVSKCDSIVTLKLTVYPVKEFPNSYLTGETEPCFGSIQTYSIPDEETGDYTWQFPQGFNIISKQKNKKTVIITDKAEPGLLILTDPNGCTNGFTSFNITPAPAYWQLLTDTICAKEEYHKNGFHIPAKDTPQKYNFARYHKTRAGCDSTVTLNLYVMPAISAGITATDSVICNNQQVSLRAWNRTSSFSSQIVGIGDILCTDGTTIKPDKFPASGKTARGIVFWVNATGQHGWAVHLENQCENCIFATVNVNIAGLPSYSDKKVAATDTLGYYNTKTIRENGNASVYNAAYAVDFDNGWYIPALGQVRQMLATLHNLNNSLAIVNGVPFMVSPSASWHYWSSTEYLYFSTSGNWVIDCMGRIKSTSKSTPTDSRLRSICSF